MKSYLKRYVSSCDLCVRGKPSRHQKRGELTPLSLHPSPWKGIFCDLIVDLPLSTGNDSKEYGSILVFVDRLTKMCHLVLRPTSAFIVIIGKYNRCDLLPWLNLRTTMPTKNQYDVLRY